MAILPQDQRQQVMLFVVILGFSAVQFRFFAGELEY